MDIEIKVGSRMKVRAEQGRIATKVVTILDAPPNSQLVQVVDANGVDYYVKRERILSASSRQKLLKVGRRDPATGRIERFANAAD